jgi:hypothetical protein
MIMDIAHGFSRSISSPLSFAVKVGLLLEASMETGKFKLEVKQVDDCPLPPRLAASKLQATVRGTPA